MFKLLQFGYEWNGNAFVCRFERLDEHIYIDVYIH